MPTTDDWKKDFVNALIGAGQGASFDFGDELYGLGGGMQSAMYGADPIEGYRAARDEARARVKQAEAESPKSYMAGNVLGSVAAPIPGASGRAALMGIRPLGKIIAEQTAKGLLTDLGKRVGISAAMGAARAAGKSEADNLKDFLLQVGTGALESADVLPTPAIATDMPRQNIGDVIDFKKMREKMMREKALGGKPEMPSGSGGNLGKPSKEMMAENNGRAMEESGLNRKRGVIDESDKPPLRLADLEKLKQDPRMLPETAIDRVYDRLDKGDSNNDPTFYWIDKIRRDGADEPYVGRDYANAIALQNPKNKEIVQPLPVPISKIGDLKGVLGKGVLTGDSDPFGWLDTKYGVSKALLEREKDKPLKIFTRSDLIAHDDYMEHLNPKKHEINIVFSTPAERVGRLIEPGAPSLARRITAANKLAEAGHKVKLHYQVFDNKNIPDGWKQFQPSEMEVMRELREKGLNPSVGLTVDKTPIQDKNLSQMLNVLGIEPKGRK